MVRHAPVGSGCHLAVGRDGGQNPAWESARNSPPNSPAAAYGRGRLRCRRRACVLARVLLGVQSRPQIAHPRARGRENTGSANLDRFYQPPRSTLPLILSPLWRQEQVDPNGWAGLIVHALDGVLHLWPRFSSPRAIGGGPPKGRSSVCRLGRLAPAKGSSLICCALRGFPTAASKIMIAAAIKTIDGLMVTPPAIRRASR
jgi:hypothetical protein